jgi:hypothetical protein
MPGGLSFSMLRHFYALATVRATVQSAGNDAVAQPLDLV